MTESQPKLGDNFSVCLKNVTRFTEEEARRRDLKIITPELFFLGLTVERYNVAFGILKRLSVNVDEIKTHLETSLASEKETNSVDDPTRLSNEMVQVIRLAIEEANASEAKSIGTGHFLLGLLKQDGLSKKLLESVGVDRTKVEQLISKSPRELTQAEVDAQVPQGQDKIQIRIAHPRSLLAKVSPVFWFLLLLLILSGYSIYQNLFIPSISTFVFVTTGWLFSLSLHEYGHAVVAYFAGDKSVEDKGYLSLNPVKYTQLVWSILLPLLYLLMGGIGLPGAAVYIDFSRIRQRWLHSLTWAAGPIMTLLFTSVLIIPFVFGIHLRDQEQHFAFWAAYSFLVQIEISVLVLTLLPIPGLDGFGIYWAYIPQRFLKIAGTLSRNVYLIFFLVFFIDNPIRTFFWNAVDFVSSVVRVNSAYASAGYHLFRFWDV